ncbi:alpha/beta fold hydrolase [Halomarina litorea]|uniref:alpha/beta fold hydrolase n=1 Tax=Halomarina litorea TaxID=2961595 RepID=UPI0020C2D376|nr:alpha/beta hydrolase [Halomarina sp. BCD28]
MQRTADAPGESTYVETGNVTLHARVAGPEDGPLVLLLHGFPEFWYGWRRQIQPLAEAGFRVVVPDQRGYNLSDRPDGKRAYRVAALVDDALGLVEATGRDSASVVGHDWGAMVAWCLAQDHPDRVDRLGILNVPHPGAFGETLRESWAQRFRSTYAGFFQFPRVPERALRAGDFRLMTGMLRGSSRPGTFTDRDLDRYQTAWGREGALTAMLNWYRANGLRSGLFSRTGRVEPETLVLWGARDDALVRENAERSLAYCERGELEVFERATHWLQHEEAAAVSDRLVEFLGEG